MSFFCNFDKSASGSILQKIAHCRLLSTFSTPEIGRRVYDGRRYSKKQISGQSRHIELQDWFVTTLAATPQCIKHNRRERGTQVPKIAQYMRSHQLARSQMNYVTIGRRYQHTGNHTQPHQEWSTTEELLALVDQYDSGTSFDHLPTLELPSLQQVEPDPQLFVSDEPVHREWPTVRYVWPARGEERKAVEALHHALNDTDLNPEEAYRLYRALPAPRVPYLGAQTRHKLLRRLGKLERKDGNSMLRYLSVVDDLKATGISLTISEWNYATSFAGRYVGRTTETEVEAGLRLWKEMEHVAGIRANSATFNILFDIATKAGKFKLAEMIYEEMERRGHAFNRFHYVSLIHYCGLQGDGEGVRKAYKSLVEAGEIVDTVVLNCTISALLRAYEPQAAERVYERMKRLYTSRSDTQMPSRNYRQRRQVAKALMKMASHARRNPTKLKRFQNQSIIAPDVQTYRILIQYLAVQAGELHKVVILLDEMRWFNVPLSGSIFLSLFKGFATHGGIRYTYWTENRLESVWRAYFQALENHHEDLFIGKWMIVWALKAFAKCSSKSRTEEIWQRVKGKWKAQDEEMHTVKDLLRTLIDI